MDQVRMRHPNLDEVVQVPASAVGQHAMAGWQVAEGEPTPKCPTCGQDWQVKPSPPPSPPDDDHDDQAPAETGASSSPQSPRRRRQSSRGSDD